MSTIESNPSQVPSMAAAAPNSASGQATSPSVFSKDFEQWYQSFDKYDSMLSDVAKISLNPKYKEDLGTVEQWYKVLTPSERTATIYHLIQSATQDQLRFFVSVIERRAKPDEPVAPGSAGPESGKLKLGKLAVRPPSLSLGIEEHSPSTPTPLTTTTESAAGGPTSAINLQDPSTWTNATNAGNTPLLPLFANNGSDATEGGPSTASIPGLSMMNPYTLNMLANAGLSSEAQLLAVQLIMSGLVQPANAPPAAKGKKQALGPNWRTTPASARFPGSALRSSGLRTTALKSAGLKSAGLESPALDSPKPEDFEPEMLNDIPAWLRGLRLHKYTSCFEGLTWQEVIVLDDAALEAKGVAALGARRRLLRTFEHARKKMGMEEDTTPTTASTPNLPKIPESEIRAPHSAVPLTRSKLSINSPIFTPTWETNSEGPNSATLIKSATSPPTSADAAAKASAGETKA
jgi:hypothetical protein